MKVNRRSGRTKAKSNIQTTSRIIKTFKDYLFDFFMLFLAVTAGYFVNNLRDDYSDKQKEKQFITSLIEDLKHDTLSISNVQKKFMIQLAGIDTLISTLEDRDHVHFTGDLYYYAVSYMTSADFFSISDRTISQLENTGSLRLIQEEGVSDRINRYYGIANNVNANTDYHAAEFSQINNSLREILNFRYIKEHPYPTIRYLDGIKLLKADEYAINYYYNQVWFFAGGVRSYLMLTSELKEEAVNLMNFIEESYNLN